MEIHSSDDLESLIRRYVILGKMSPKGFHSVKCQVCNDYQERGGFKFEGDTVGYNCFNCGAKAVYLPDDPDSKYSISKNMKEILISFGIPDDEIKKTISLRFFNPNEKKETVTQEKKNLSFPINEIDLPKDSYSILKDDSIWGEIARMYLRNRGIDLTTPFFVSESEKYVGRVIIPYYFRDKIIYWQGRALDDTITPRYKNPVADKDNIFFNMDEIYRYTDDPLFVTEGPLDSLSIGRTAVATLGSSLSEFQMRELKKAASRRKIIFVIDKNRNGYKLGMSVLSDDNPNFYVACFPDNIEDANDALQKLGKLFIASHLSSTAVNGFSGKLLLEMKCSKK
jgi:hypothetical protein